MTHKLDACCDGMVRALPETVVEKEIDTVQRFVPDTPREMPITSAQAPIVARYAANASLGRNDLIQKAWDERTLVVYVVVAQ